MNLRKLLISCSSLLLFILILNFFFGIFRIPFVSVCAYEAVPTNTAFIASWKHTDQLSTRLDSLSYMETSDQLGLVQKLKSDYELLQGLLEQAAINTSVLAQAAVVAAMQTSRSSDVNFTIFLEDYDASLDLKELMSKLETYKILPFKFKQQTIYSIKDNKTEIASMASYKGLIIFARYAYMVEDAISQLKSISTNLCRNKAFKKIRRLANQTNAIELYFNFENIPFLYSSFLKNKYRTAAKKISNLGTWYRLDLSFQARSIALKGRGLAPAGSKFFQSLSHAPAVKDEDLATVLPDNVAIMLRLGLKDFKNFDSKHASGAQDFNNYILPWLDQSVAHVITEPYSNKLDAEQFALFKAKDIALAKQHIDSLMQVNGTLESYEYNTYQVHRLLLDDLLQGVFGPSINAIQNPYMVFFKNYVVFCNSKQALEIWIDKYIAGQTLDKDLSYLEFQAGQEGRAKQFEIFVNPKYIAQLLKPWLKPELRNALNQDFDHFTDIKRIHIAANNAKRQLDIDGQVIYAAEEKEQTSVIWKKNMKHELILAPNILTNPQTKEKEIIVQDAANYIYLLNSEGKLLWKRLLEHPILSDIHQIDYYKNGQGQFLFNTKHKIYLLDREGKEVSSFPLRLQSEITNGVCVVESENRNEYQFFVACRNRNIYGFDRSGAPIPGWNPKSGAGKLAFPLIHFQEADKDFILALNTQGKLFAFKRNGSNRFSPKSFKTKFLSPPDFQIQEGANRIVLGDEHGKAHVVNFSGGSFSLQASTNKEESLQFIFADVVGDQRKDYITMSAKALEIFYYEEKEFKKAGEYQYEDEQDELFAIQLNKTKKSYIGSLSKKKQQINLIDASGKQYPGFPLAGTSKFKVTELFNNGKNILLVANGKSIYTYKLPSVK